MDRTDGWRTWLSDEMLARYSVRVPIKLNKMYWPDFLTTCLPSADDPRLLTKHSPGPIAFSRAVSVFKFGTTFKTTQRNRYPLTLQYLSGLEYSPPPVILDIGASDGSTSLDAIETIAFQKFYITDLHLEILYATAGNTWYFYDCQKGCILIVTNKWVVYPDTTGAFFPFGLIAKYLFSKSPSRPASTKKLYLLNPEISRLLPSQKIVIRSYNVLAPWDDEPPDLIIAANILNNFNHANIGRALVNIFQALKDPGRLVILENKQKEKSTVFQVMNNRITIEKSIHGGTSIEDLVLTAYRSVQSRKNQQ